MEQHHELIDTLWNVNAKALSIMFKQKLELIDTLWNVNEGYNTYIGARYVN